MSRHNLILARTRTFISLLILSSFLVLVGCGANPFSGPPPAAPTPLLALPTNPTSPIAVVTATSEPTTIAEVPTAEPKVRPSTTTVVPATSAAQPTLTPLPRLTLPPTLAPTVAPLALPTISTGAKFTQVKIFLIAIEDGGKSGPKIGCNDSVVAVDRTIAPTAAPLTAALNQLFSLHTQFYGQSGLYNALYRANIQVSKVTIVNGKATIQLTGTLNLGGECDDPRVEAQITQTALQFSTVRAVDVFMNGKPLQSILGGKGE